MTHRSLLASLLLLGCGEPAAPQLLPANAVPTVGALTLTVSPLVVGEMVTISVSGAQPGRTITLLRAAGVAPGGICPGLIAPVCLDLAGPPQVAMTLTADSQGRARSTFRFPSVPAALQQVALQAAYPVSGGADTSNAVLAPIYQDLDWSPADPPLREDPVVLSCGNTIPAATSGVCNVTAGVTLAKVVRGTVLTPRAVYEDGEVVIDSAGDIVCAGCDCAASPFYAGATEIDCAEGVISPGLINAHDHITFSQGDPLPPSSTRYEHRHDWRGDPTVSTPQNADGTGYTSAGTRWVELRNVMAGATTLVGSGAASGMLRNPDRNLDEGIDLPDVEYETFPLGDASRSFRADCNWSYSLDERQAEAEPAVLSHVAEGIDFFASEEFRCQSSSFDGGQDLTQPNISHVHGIGLDAIDYSVMASNHTELVWAPRSNISLYGHTADVALLHRLGGVVGLGTDWSYTGSINMLRELTCADEYNDAYLDGFFSDADLWRMATMNNALALGAQARIGAIAPGLVADLTIFDGSQSGHHRAVLDAESSDVALVLRGGVPLFGEADLTAGLGRTCDPVDVCGVAMAICTSPEWSTSLAALQSATAGSYPLFFCGTPTDEPTCIPSRPGEFTGITATADLDGDGIVNADDNCPTVFNPIRPIDGGAQPDADADGTGDACDAVPLPADIDGDGLPNMLDNCPLDADPSGTDADGDGVGDVCDFCPGVANPDTVCPPAAVTIVEVRTGLASGRVVVDGVVTGVGSSGFTLQDPTVLDGVNAGIYVYTGGAPTVARGDDINMLGTTGEYFGESQLTNPDITLLGTATIAPVPVTVADATLEIYEGVLVTLIDGVVSNLAYSCAVDGSCADPGLWEIDGATGVVVFDRLYEDVDWASHIGELPVTGVMSFRWNRRRIMPRDALDFGP